MKPEMSKRFDAVMARIKPIEPSTSFESKFQEQLKKAAFERKLFAGLAAIKPSASFDETFLTKLRAAEAEMAKEPFIIMLSRKLSERAEVLSWRVRTPRLAYAVTFLLAVLVGGYLFAARTPEYLTIASINGISRCGEGKVIETGNNTTTDIMLKGKYTIRLKENSVIQVAKLTPRLGKGIARFTVKHGAVLVNIEEKFKGSKFIIDTDTAEAVALGTKFSVDVSKKRITDIKVLEGKVEVKNQGNIYSKQGVVIVASGQKTAVEPGSLPGPLKRLSETEWLEFEELYSLGSKAKVMLMIKNTPDRVLALLKPCALYVSDEKPREIPRIIDKALETISDAIQNNDTSKHREAINMLENLVREYPNKKYNTSLLLYIAAYYRYLGLYDDAIKTCKKVVALYPDSTLASLAECAIGVIYEKDLNDSGKANQIYRRILTVYPNSLESIWVEKKRS